jgi:multiple antibiotic resistance protein
MDKIFNFKEIFSVSLILFSVIDIIGAIPVIINLRKKIGKIDAFAITLVSGIIMVGFLYIGKSILNLFGVDIKSFSVAGAIIIFLIGLEMTLGRNIFKHEVTEDDASTPYVPLAFPIIAGAGTMTTIMSLKSQFEEANVLVGIFLNLIFIFFIIRTSEWIERKIGKAGEGILRKVFGVILLAISIKIFKTSLGV